MDRVEIIDNFLPDSQFKGLENIFLGSEFSWYYNFPDQDNQFQFTHTFFDTRPPWNGARKHFDLTKIFLKPLGVRGLIKIKSNLQTKTLFHRKSPGGYHIDFPNVLTSVYYVNTNNGWTHIKGHGKVKSVANRMVVFDSNLEHTGYSCTNESVRVVINFNFVR